MKLSTLAWRNVWRNRRRTAVTVAAMTFALLAMVLYSALVQGYIRGMERNILDLEMGEIQIAAQGYRKSPSLYRRIEQPDSIVEGLKKSGFSASSRVLGSGMIAAGDVSAGASFRGLDIALDAQVSDLHEHLAQGKWLESTRDHDVVLGGKLAKVLGVGVGDEVLALSQAADGSMANDLFYVRGVLKNIADSVDRSGVYMTQAAFREFFVLPVGAHQILVRVPDSVLLADAVEATRRVAPKDDVKTWKELAPTLSSMMDSMQGAMFAMFLIIYMAIGIVMLNAMLMAVFERIREIGILKALGESPQRVLGMIFLESGIQVAISLVFGLGLSLPCLWYLSEIGIDLTRFGESSIAGVAWDPIWKAQVEMTTFTGPVVTMVVIVALAVVYPAVKAARIRPVTAMRLR